MVGGWLRVRQIVARLRTNLTLDKASKVRAGQLSEHSTCLSVLGSNGGQALSPNDLVCVYVSMCLCVCVCLCAVGGGLSALGL
jgi:hypothetical protein